MDTNKVKASEKMPHLEYLREFFNHSDELYIVCNEKGELFDCNDAFCDVLEIERSHTPMVDPYSFLHIEDVKKIGEALKAVMEQKLKNKTINHRLIPKSGKVRYLSWKFTYIPEKNVCVGVGRDNTEEFYSDNILKQTQTLGKIGSWEYDIQTDELSWSDETYKIYELEYKSFISIRRIRGFFRDGRDSKPPVTTDTRMLSASCT